MSDTTSPAHDEIPGLDALPDGPRRAVPLILAGYDDAEVAAELGIDASTAFRYRTAPAVAEILADALARRVAELNHGVGAVAVLTLHAIAGVLASPEMNATKKVAAIRGLVRRVEGAWGAAE